VTVRLVALPLPVLRSLAAGDVAAAEESIGLAMPAEFSGHLDIWHYMISLLDGRPENTGWTMSAVALDDEIVGNAGFKGAPDRSGEVEIGYGILTARRRQGLAVAAAGLLLDRAAREPSVTSVLATIAPDNLASVGVVTKAGFRADGDRLHPRWGRQLVFRRPPPAI
jgi:ribosomal-protein-alanine N-acetyltransferase